MRCFMLLAFLLSLSFVNSQQIELKKNGYQNILISISDTISYDANLLPRIKELFNDASATLFAATGYRAYFKDVTILVPTSWTVPEAVPATTESFDKANIRVDQPSSRYGNNPWVRNTGGCGVPGEFMHLTPQFITDIKNSVRKWGPQEKVVVHEWGHLRWGLFDEYPVGEDVSEHFYQSATSNTVEASRCNINVKGRMRHRMTGASCKIDPVTSLPEADCRFYPNKAQTTALSSFMYYHFLPSVESFCDDDDLGAQSVHNYEAPSKHNKLCAGQSSWSVMRQSPDFSNGKNSAMDAANHNTNITFKVVQRQESRVAVVMDISRSMEINDYYIQLNSAVRRYLLYTVPDGASVGLVKYNSVATALTSGLQKVSTVTDREQLADLVPLEHNSGTAIGRGLLQARKMLEMNGGDLKGSRIVLVTDGEENVQPYVDTVQPDLVRDGVVVDTVLLTPKASQVLISLAAQTGGMSFYASGDSQSTSLSDAFTTSERARTSDPKSVPVTIESRVVTAKTGVDTCYNVTVDDALGRETTFTFSWVKKDPLAIVITNTNSTERAKLEQLQTAAAYTCAGQCATGTWTVCINNVSDSKAITSQVESKARIVTPKAGNDSDDEELLPITVKTNIVNKEPDFNKKGTKPVSLFAVVTRGYSPVIGASVNATIEAGEAAKSGSRNNTVKMAMRDDGAGADIVKGDGIYSAYILNADKTGKHTISVVVASDDGTKVKTFKASSSAGSISEPGEGISTATEELTPSGDFQRFSLAGFMDVKSVRPADRDLHPPSRIIDLTVTEASYDRGRITLEWTAVGDDFDEGSASSYELWKADSHRTMYKARLENATLVNSTHILQGNLSSPLPAYSREKLVINIADKDEVAVYAIIATDEQGNPNDLSNIVSVKLVYVPPEDPSTTESSTRVLPTKSSTTESNTRVPPKDSGKTENNTMVIAIGAGVGGAVLIIVILAAIIGAARAGKICNGGSSSFSGNTHTNKAYQA